MCILSCPCLHFVHVELQQQDFARERSAQIERNEFEERFPRLPLSAQRLYQGDPCPHTPHKLDVIVSNAPRLEPAPPLFAIRIDPLCIPDMFARVSVTAPAAQPDAAGWKLVPEQASAASADECVLRRWVPIADPAAGIGTLHS